MTVRLLSVSPWWLLDFCVQAGGSSSRAPFYHFYDQTKNTLPQEVVCLTIISITSKQATVALIFLFELGRTLARVLEPFRYRRRRIKVTLSTPSLAALLMLMSCLLCLELSISELWNLLTIKNGNDY